MTDKPCRFLSVNNQTSFPSILPKLTRSGGRGAGAASAVTLGAESGPALGAIAIAAAL
ncbi:MAG TPA: hypothetical protein VGQ57_13660 [Polyangiaceae bacterium]|nr:hypothetical protein [Polyangiaceae bacterium]